MSAAAKAVFEADTSKLDSALLKVQQSMLKLHKAVATLHFGFEALKAAGEFIAKEFEHVKEAFAVGKELNELSARTGIAVGELVQLTEEFKKVGKTSEDIGPAINRMQRNLSEGKASEVVKRLGLNMKDLRSMTPIDQFHALGGAIGKMQNPMDRAAAAMKIFGRTGAELLPLFMEKGFGEFNKDLAAKAAIFQRDAGLFADVTNSFRIVGDKVKGFWLGVADKVAPVLKPLLDSMKSISFTKLGQQLGDAVALLIQSLSDGSITRILADALTAGGEIGCNAVIQGFVMLGDFLLECLTAAFTDSESGAESGMDDLADHSEDVIGTALENAWNNLDRVVNSWCGGLGPLVGQELFEAAQIFIKACAIVASGDFWAGVGYNLLSAANSFNALLLDGIAALLQKLSGLPLLGQAFAEAAGAARDAAAQSRDWSTGNDKSAEAAYNKALAPLQKQMQDSMTAIIKAQPKGWDTWSGFDTHPAIAKLTDAIAKEKEATKRTTDKSLAAAPTNKVLEKVPEAILGDKKENFSHLQRIGGGGYSGGMSPQAEQKKQTSLLDKINTGVKEVRDKLGSKPSPALAFGYP